jgi:hypothetical protein
MAIVDTYIGCRVGDVTICNGKNHKNLIPYTPTKPFLEAIEQIWIEVEEKDTLYENPTKSILIIDR